MTGPTPEIIVKKIIRDDSTAGIAVAEQELFSALTAGIPSVARNTWRSATSNDIGEMSTGERVVAGDLSFVVSYMGTRKSMLGSYLLCFIDTLPPECCISRAEELPFFRQMIDARVPGMVSISQMRADVRRLSVVHGRKSDVLSYLLGVLAGCDNGFLAHDEKTDRPVFPCAALALLAQEWFKEDELVSVSGVASGRFLRRCFREASTSMSRAEFDLRFGSSGVYWRPRLPRRWLSHPL